MFAFVGYIVHANGIKFPWAMQLDGTPFPSVTNAPEAWDQISDAAKWQIFTFIGFLEFVSRNSNVAVVHLVKLEQDVSSLLGDGYGSLLTNGAHYVACVPSPLITVP